MTQSNTKKAIDVSKLVPPKIDPARKLSPKKTFSFNPLDNHLLDTNTTCNIEEAIAKMLGWLRSPLRLDPQEIRIGNITIEEMPYLHELNHDVDEYLIMFREEAVENFFNIDNDASASEEKKQKAIEALSNCDYLIDKAAHYRCALEDELIKESGSRLRIHKVSSESNDQLHITLKSLFDWAYEEFELNIFENIPSKPLEYPAAKKDKSIKINDEKGLSKVKADNLYKSFAILIHAFVNNSSNKSKYLINGKLNKEALSRDLFEQASQLDAADSQSKESIKTRIEIAFKIIKEETKKFTL